MSQHWTPGPWRYEHDGDVRNIRAPDGGLVAQLCHLRGKWGVHGRRADTEVVDNGKLIAAAPDMFHALRIIASYSGNDEAACVAQQMASNAIAKVES